MHGQWRVVGLTVVVAALGGASLVAAADGIERAAVVSTAARRVDPPDAASSPPQSSATQMVDLVNGERARHGLSPLRWHDRVGVAASVHAADMAAQRRMQHAGSDGSDGGDRLTRAGFAWGAWGETIGAGFVDPGTLFEAWLASPSHRRQLLGDFDYVGVAGARSSDDVPYWALVVAS